MCAAAVLLAGCGARSDLVDVTGRADASLDAAVPTLSDAEDEGDATGCFILASNYDTSCSVSADCVGTAGGFGVNFGNYCDLSCAPCGGQAINRNSVAKYITDVSKTPLGSAWLTGKAGCSCVGEGEVACVNGICDGHFTLPVR
jgi:hypothetical protein